MVIIRDIDVTKRQQGGEIRAVSSTGWTLQQYRAVAKRCIGAFASPSLAKSMLRSEDAIAFVVEKLVYGAHKWELSRGRTLHSYLNQCSIWAIRSWIEMIKSQPQLMSINMEYHDSHSQLYESLPDFKADTPDNIVANKERTEELSNVISSAGLTERQSYCLEVVYVEGQRPSDVARDLGISRQAVDQCLDKGIRKVQVALHGKEQLFT